MELKIGVQELARALARSQGIVEKKSTMPILSHVLLEAAKGDVLHVSATDLDISVSSEHGCEVLKEGRVAVPAKFPKASAACPSPTSEATRLLARPV